MVRHTLLWIARVGVAGGAFALLAWLGHFPIGSAETESLLRLAWRKSGAQVRLCTERGEEELLRLPPHMRQRQICEDHIVPYRLTVSVGGEARIDRLVLPRGARGDRPIYVQEDMRLTPGAYAVTVEFAPVVPAPNLNAGEDDDERENGEEGEEGEKLRQAIAATPRYRLDREIRTEAGRITLIEIDESTREFKVRGP